MKKIATLVMGVLAGGAALLGAKADKPAQAISIDPPHWWVGMANDTLQLMLHSPGIGNVEFSTDYPGVKIDRQFKLDSDNYRFIYLTIAPDTRPGEVKFDYTVDGRKRSFNYELRARDRKAEDYIGFDAGDVLYLLMPDRFAKGLDDKQIDMSSLDYKVGNDRSNPNARHGGDMRGIRNHLDYIDDLGVTAIWACPVLENDMPGGSYHGYATTDYYKVDPRFGSNQEWKDLVSDAHKRGLKVVMDMIFNHSGSNHPWMKDMPSKDWYNHPDGSVMTNHKLVSIHDPYASDYDKAKNVDGWFVLTMPDLNQRNPHLLKYLTQNSIWWIEESKINGIRMDTYPYADLKAMAKWAGDVMREYPNFNIVGESWYNNEVGSAYFQKDSKLNPVNTNLPTVMDFYYVNNAKKNFSEDTTPWNGGLHGVYEHLTRDVLFANPDLILTFLDNHDTDRFLDEMPENLDNWKQAMALLLTSRGIPQLYYGTELLMNGSKKISDGLIRLDMPGGFPGDEVNVFTAEGRTPIQNEAWDYLSKLLNWRRSEARDVMAKGSLKHFAPENCVYIYERRLGDKQVLVILNGRDQEVTVPLESIAEIAPAGSTFKNIIDGKTVVIDEEMDLAPRAALILQNW